MIECSWSNKPVRPMTWKERRAPRLPGWLKRIFGSRHGRAEQQIVIRADELGVLLWEFLTQREDYTEYAVATFAQHTRLEPSRIRLELFVFSLAASYWAISDLFDIGAKTAVHSWLLTAVEALSNEFRGSDFLTHVRVRAIRGSEMRTGRLSDTARPPVAESADAMSYEFLDVFQGMQNYASRSRLNYGNSRIVSELPWIDSAVEVFLDKLKQSKDPVVMHKARLAATSTYSAMVDLIRQYDVLPVNA
ncbi:MAG TPA: hypothetical protein VF105_02985 [Gemmatimonadaceae bacterium]